MIELKSLSKKFNSYVIKDFSYSFDANKIYYLKGPNGSGKTTLLKLIKGTYTAESGEISFNNGLNQKDDIVYIDNNSRSFFHRLTVNQNLEYFYSLQTRNDNNHFSNELIDFFEISNIRDKKFSSLSQGQMQIISIIRGFLSGAQILLLDEVFSSLDDIKKKKVFDYLSNFILKEKKMVIFTSHEKSLNSIDFEEICLK